MLFILVAIFGCYVLLTSYKSRPRPGATILANFDRSFGREDVSSPMISGPLTADNDGNLYWTSPTVGAEHGGVIFRMTADGRVSPAYTFDRPDVDAVEPINGVIQASDGNFYGTTRSNRPGTVTGTLYRLTLRGEVTVLHTFGVEKADPQLPNSLLVEDQDGMFYGTTAVGGLTGDGAVYRMTRAGKFSVLHFFGDDEIDGKTPSGGLTLGADGNLYGTTEFGGRDNRGIVYQLTPTGKLTVLHSFGSVSDDGENPKNGVVQDNDGNLYGTTGAGGRAGVGAIFKISPNGDYALLYSFPRSVQGDGVGQSSIIAGSDGFLYGTTCSAGANRIGNDFAGQFFRLSKQGEMTSLYSFGATPGDGVCPEDERLVAGTNGIFYGSTFAGGTHGLGTIYRMVVPK
uniref:choice-of-anchor tandem repeat GloVer-containing protein n=1 Tax=Castellaniella defragrans TaxID=75697 RepID=UPI00333F820F